MVSELEQAVARLGTLADGLPVSAYNSTLSASQVAHTPELKLALASDLRALLAAHAATSAEIAQVRSKLGLAVKALEQIRDQPDVHPMIGGRWVDWAKGRARATLAEVKGDIGHVGGAMPTCGTCKNFGRDDVTPRLGGCSMWLTGYNTTYNDIPDNGVLIENDEGWGAIMGENFGCVLHAPIIAAEVKG